ncbi:hypothetical protein MFLAVUS_002262 [Mucor flavus]|uniref:Uncharacterized protein n=1 Tax=Mucor flavus TaxID=439312 RepID=A0ABP9YPR9_9FUNG
MIMIILRVNNNEPLETQPTNFLPALEETYGPIAPIRVSNQNCFGYLQSKEPEYSGCYLRDQGHGFAIGTKTFEK